MPNNALSEEQLAAVAPLSQTLHQLDQAHRRFRAHIARCLALSGVELTALVLIIDTPGISPGTLAGDLGLTAGAVTALIDRLEDSGHVQRVAKRTDRRSLEIRLTDAGRNTLTQMRDAYRTVLHNADPHSDLTRALPHLDTITRTLNTAARTQQPLL